jgi:N4-bis(aminopropyl)spermidine synthase
MFESAESVPTPASLPPQPVSAVGEAIPPGTDPVGEMAPPTPPRRTHESAYLRRYLHLPFSDEELRAVELVTRARPTPLRQFDQISMVAADLLAQVKMVAPYLTDKRVAFVGDLDSASLLLGLLSVRAGKGPSEMMLLDFDERLVNVAVDFAQTHGFGDVLQAQRYNFFEPVPAPLIGRYDSFYTNPPYGSRNEGASGRLFIARGYELTKPLGASGCIILPYDDERAWTQRAMYRTQGFLHDAGWVVSEKIDRLHRYHLDDDATLTSAMMLIDRVIHASAGSIRNPFAGRRVAFDEIEHFYGFNVPPPYPRFIRSDGTSDDDWGTAA